MKHFFSDLTMHSMMLHSIKLQKVICSSHTFLSYKTSKTEKRSFEEQKKSDLNDEVVSTNKTDRLGSRPRKLTRIITTYIAIELI